VKDALCPGASVAGANPLKLKPAPLALAAETDMLVPPEFVKVSDKLVLLPTWTLPNDKPVGVALNVPWATPVPLSGMVRLLLEAFELILTLPVAAPLVVGANCTVKDVLWPAVSVIGDKPLKLKPVPLAPAPAMDMLVPPVLVRVSDKLVLLPSWTLPNDRLVEVAVSVPGAIPVPLSGILTLEFVPFEMMLRLPLAVPVVVGVKSTAKDVVWPGVRVTGANPLKLKPVPLALAVEIERLVPPLLVNVSDKLVLLPTWTLPNDRLVGLGASVPGVIPVPDRFNNTIFPFPWFSVVSKATLPLKEPVAGGAKVTAIDVDEAGANTSGNEMLLIANPAPLIVALFIVRSVPPEFMRTTVLVW
jgi:hypothetical protein